ncbi:BTB/POZ protein [Rhizophagus irregularis DAOM 181602=DAOM 197198]|nr:BTB/POZ protein [Rhizophagus irregularis DAOM 181602=DAOM 197198]
MEDYRFLPNLSQNLLTILNDDEYYDVTIEVGKDPYVKVFRAHMVILTYRSPYLRRILSTNVKKNDGTLAHIKLPNISPETFQIILRYIYGGRLSLKEYDVSDIIKILIVANELNLQEIVTYLQSFLIVNKKNWMEQNFNLIYKTSFENESLLKLQNFCTELITKEPSKIFKSIDFNSISEKTLISLIRHENLKMSNVQVWEHVLKWDHEHKPNNKPEQKVAKEISSKAIDSRFLDHEHKYNKPEQKNKNSIENYILSRVKDEQYAIFNNPNHGPSFGSGLVLFGNDFFNMSYCKNMKKYPNYEKSIRETEKTFSVEEYEIFQITKN